MLDKSPSILCGYATVLARIGVTPNTRVVALMRVEYLGKKGWQVWIAVDRPQSNYSEWKGTFLFMADDGSVTRVTVDDEDLERTMVIKGADK